MNDSQDKLMLRLGFHRHKPSHRGKGKYFAVGGYDLTKEQANLIYKVFNSEREKIDAHELEQARIEARIDENKHLQEEVYYALDPNGEGSQNDPYQQATQVVFEDRIRHLNKLKQGEKA